MSEPGSSPKATGAEPKASTYEDALAFGATLPGVGRLLGLDLGTKTIGLALSDLSRTIASPLTTLTRVKLGQDIVNLDAVIATHKIAGLVLGLPRHMDGAEGARAQSTRAFARNVNRQLPLPILLWDERLSTAAATRVLLEVDASRKRRAELVDKLAATVILQSLLDRLRQTPRHF